MRSRERSTEAESALAYPGWRVVGASVFGVMLGYAVLVPYTFSLFIKPLGGAFGWRRDQISLALTWVAVTAATCSALIGWLIDKVGPRRVIIACSLTFGLAFASLALLGPHIVQLYLVYYAYLLSRYYSLERFSLLYGCAWTAFAAGTAAGPYLMGVLYTHAGSYQARGIQTLAVPTIVSAVLMLFMPRYSAIPARNPHSIERTVLATDPIASD